MWYTIINFWIIWIIKLNLVFDLEHSFNGFVHIMSDCSSNVSSSVVFTAANVKNKHKNHVTREVV